MSILVDKLYNQLKNYGWEQDFNGTYYFVKDYDIQIISISTFIYVVKTRIKDAFRVLIGKSRAYHYKEDE